MSFLADGSFHKRNRNLILNPKLACVSLAPFNTQNPLDAQRTVLLLHCDDDASDSRFGDVQALFQFDGQRDDYSANNATLTYSGTAQLDLSRSFELGNGSVRFPTQADGSACTSSVLVPYASSTVDSAMILELAFWAETPGVIATYGNITISIDAGANVSFAGATFATAPAAFNQWISVAVLVRNNGVNEASNIYRYGGSFGGTAGILAVNGGLLRLGSGANIRGWVSAVRLTISNVANMRYEQSASYNVVPVPSGFGNNAPFGRTANTQLQDKSCSTPKTVNTVDRAMVTPIYKQFNRGIWIPRYASNNASPTGAVVSPNADFNLGTDEFTIAGWGMRLDNARQGEVFYAEEAGGAFELQIGITGRFTITYRSSGGVQSVTPVQTITVGVPFHWAVQRRTIAGVSTFELYFNGTRIDNRAVTGGAASTVNITGSIYLGREPAASDRQINGMLDEIVMVRGGCLFNGDFLVPNAAYCDFC